MSQALSVTDDVDDLVGHLQAAEWGQLAGERRVVRSVLIALSVLTHDKSGTWERVSIAELAKVAGYSCRKHVGRAVHRLVDLGIITDYHPAHVDERANVVYGFIRVSKFRILGLIRRARKLANALARHSTAKTGRIQRLRAQMRRWGLDPDVARPRKLRKKRTKGPETVGGQEWGLRPDLQKMEGTRVADVPPPRIDDPRPIDTETPEQADARAAAKARARQAVLHART